MDQLITKLRKSRTGEAARVVAGSVDRTEGTGGTRRVWSGWLRLIVASVARAVLGVVVALGAWGAAPTIVGWQPTTVMSGSMLPRLFIGDVAVAMPTATDRLATGQVLLFDDPDHQGRLRLHRFVGVDANGLLITRGDANNADDSSHVAADTIAGVAVLRVPMIGVPIIWLKEGQLVNVALLAAALILLLALTIVDHDLQRRTEGSDRGADSDADDAAGASGSDRGADSDAPETPAAVGRRMPALVRAAMAGVAPVAALIVMSAAMVPSWAAYRESAAAPVSNLTAANYYSCVGAAMGDNPYLFWKLDETSGSTAADSSGNGRTGTFVNGGSSSSSTACTGTGGAGRSVLLNGSNQYIATTSTTAIKGSDTFTVETWIKTSTNRGGRLVGFGSSRTGASTTADRHLYLTNSGAVVFGVIDGSVKRTVASGSGLNDGSWHLVAATLSSSGMRLYVDGELAASNGDVDSAAATTGYWRVGYDRLAGWASAPQSDYFSGQVDNVVVYNTALSPGQLAAHFDAAA